MADPYLGEIRLLSFNYAPVNWLPCDGRVLAITDYSALYAILGTTYGGDGASTFKLPDLRGRFPVGAGQRPDSDVYVRGSQSGWETVVLTSATIPSHTHTVNSTQHDPPAASAVLKCSSVAANNANPAGNVSAPSPGTPSNDPPRYTSGTANATMLNKIGVISGTTDLSGGAGGDHYNMSPYCVLNYCICTNGIFPTSQ